MKKILFAGVLAIISIAAHAQKVKPALKLTKGDTYYLVTSSVSEINQNMNGQANNINLNVGSKLSFKVLNADDSLYYMEVNYMILTMKMQLPTGNVAFDSNKKDAADVVSSLLAGLTNKPFTARITKTGKVRAVDNIEVMISSVIDGFPQAQGVQKEQLKTQLLQTFGSATIKGNIEMIMAIFPDKAVSKNDEWHVNTDIGGTMAAKLASVYRLVDVTPQNYVIHGEASINSDPAIDYKAMMGVAMKYNIKGTMVSDIKTDKITGWVTESNIKQVIDGTIDIKDSPQTPGGLSFPMSAKTETVITAK
ncbi:DUF6263 family protein [Mucilaginibacter angelicae]|uniref:DUF6263 family protein n=1 Tax=Mucilaginibacter angelicae TaxID=869718 RepID=A0ABV6LC11_9SPHI